MPTLLTWVFEGGNADPDASQRMQERAMRRGQKQRVYSGDAVDDDVLGVGTIQKLDGGSMTVNSVSVWC